VTIEFPCLNCGSALKAPDEYAGKIAKCKKCQFKVLIPKVAEVELVLEPNAVPQSPYEKMMGNLREELKKMGFPDLKGLKLSDLSDEDVKAIFDWGMWTYGLGSSDQGSIDEIKYDGHLVVLDDGSRWEVDDGDTYTTDGWCEGDEVFVINGRMYRLDELESVEVTKK
jgi:DNA-directed RNA polymerase subunit RPC12/RpoP